MLHPVASVDESCSKHKLELIFEKIEPIQWTSLEQTFAGAGSTKPAYPSSARKPINLEALNLEPEAPVDNEAQVDAFFKQLYKDADEDTRRAMNKSFAESGGTVLSTNWDEVKQKKIEPSPPSGMEVKTFDS